MKKLDISSVIYYGRNYGGDKIWWFFSMDEFEVISRDDLISRYNFSDEMLSDEQELNDAYRFVPMFQVYIPDEIRAFLTGQKNRRVDKEISALNDDQLCIYFRKQIELDFGDSHRWGEHERQVLQQAAENWCRKYHIPYFIG